MSAHPGDEALARLAERDPDVDPDATAHVAACPACRERIARHQGVGALLESFAPGSRNLCPPREQLAAQRTLRGAPLAELDRHLAACALCREDLADLAALERPPVPSLAVRLAQGILTLVENAFGELLPAAEPSLALARGGSAGGAVGARRDLGDAVLEVALGSGRGGVDASVSLTPKAGAPGTLERFRAELAVRGRLVEGREAEGGRVVFDGLAPGSYELVVYRAGSRAAACELDLGIEA